jgi:DNA-binding NtrC family response regulator
MNATRFVVIDEDSSVLALLQGILKAAFPNAQIIELSDAEAAFWRILSDPPDLVLTDYKIGENELDGATLTSRLRSHGIAVPVIMVSNHPCANEMADAAGVTAFLEKVQVIEDLIPTVRALTMPALQSA